MDMPLSSRQVKYLKLRADDAYISNYVSNHLAAAPFFALSNAGAKNTPILYR